MLSMKKNYLTQINNFKNFKMKIKIYNKNY